MNLTVALYVKRMQSLETDKANSGQSKETVTKIDTEDTDHICPTAMIHNVDKEAGTKSPGCNEGLC